MFKSMGKKIITVKFNANKISLSGPMLTLLLVNILTLCMLGNLLLSSADFFQDELFQKILSGTPSECQNNLDTDQDRHSVGPDLGPNCLQRLSADDLNRR